MMADWAKGYTAGFSLVKVDVDAWKASGSAIPVRSLSISRDCTDQVPLLEEATAEVTGDFEDGWYQAVMVADGEKIPLGVFEFATTSRTYDHGTVSVTASGRSVLRPADGTKLVTGDYAPMGSNGASYAALLLQRAFSAPVNVEGGFTLAQHVVFGSKMSYLEAAWILLDAGGYCIQLGGDGSVNIMPRPKEPSLELSRANASLLVPGVKADSDTRPKNRYYAVEGGSIAVAQDDGLRSLYGYWDDEVDTSPVRVNGETLAAYARRKLREASAIRRKASYTREFWPGVRPFSVVRGSMADIGLDGDFVVTSQQLRCEHGITVEETCEELI